MSEEDFNPEFACVADFAALYRELGLQAVPAMSPGRDVSKAWKRPALRDWRSYQNKLVSDEQFAAWFPPDYVGNIGVITGACSGDVFVVDCDFQKGPEASLWWLEVETRQEHAGELETVSQRTGGGGQQYFYRAPDGWIPPTGKNGELHVDIRGAGGFVMIAPSMHESGQRYEWLEGFEPWVIEIAEAPRWFCEELEKLFGQGTVVDTPAGSLSHRATVKTPSPASVYHPFGGIMDGREEKMREMVWGCLVRTYREALLLDDNPDPPSPEAQWEMMEELFDSYANHIARPRLDRPGVSREALLEEEGRGATEFSQKWRAAIRKWHNEIRRDALAGPPIRLEDVDHAEIGSKFAAKLGEQVEQAVNAADPKLPEPVDLWGYFPPPLFPYGLLPTAIDDLAKIQGEVMGADPAGFAMAALAVCGAAIPDSIKCQPKEHDKHWLERRNIWVALVGDPSTKKSPILSIAVRPLRSLDIELYKQYQQDLETYNGLPDDERRKEEKPKQERLIIEDTTIEAAQEVLKDSPNGVLCYQDELSGFFGAIDKYGGARGAAKDRSFWLLSFNGGHYNYNRINRGSVYIENLCVSLLGGIQPEPIRKLASDSADDGLLQRLLPIVLRPATIGRDVPTPDVVEEYHKLVHRLHELCPPTAKFHQELMPLRFSQEAQAVRRELEAKHLELMNAEFTSKKLGSHIGKYDGIYARLCVIVHCIENVNERQLPSEISLNVAQRVADFMHRFLLPHAFAFYCGILHLASDHDRLAAVAGYILANRCAELTARDLQRGIQTMKNLDRQSRERLCEQLEALGWLTEAPSARTASKRWVVNPRVHDFFIERAETERRRREGARQIFAEMATGDKP